MVHPPIDRPLQVVDVVWILAHTFAWRVRYLRHITVVTKGSLHDDVKRRHIRVVRDERSDTEGGLRLSLEIFLQLRRLLKVQAIAEEQGLRLRVDAKLLVVGVCVIPKFIILLFQNLLSLVLISQHF